MKKKTMIIIITILLVIAIAVGVAIVLSSKRNSENEKGLILPEAKNDKIETEIPSDAENTTDETKEKVNASYDEFMEIYEQYKNETDETKKREQLDKIQAILDSASK